jgi:glycine/D-amino acid oxidase-like deaminating enzyme
MKVVIVGAGCIGLTTGISLFESKSVKDVLIVADRFSPMTTTNQSGALWRPVFVGEGDGEAERVQRWGEVCPSFPSRYI